MISLMTKSIMEQNYIYTAIIVVVDYFFVVCVLLKLKLKIKIF